MKHALRQLDASQHIYSTTQLYETNTSNLEEQLRLPPHRRASLASLLNMQYFYTRSIIPKIRINTGSVCSLTKTLKRKRSKHDTSSFKIEKTNIFIRQIHLNEQLNSKGLAERT